jgi:RND family efflux transporter MFP subunit
MAPNSSDLERLRIQRDDAPASAAARAAAEDRASTKRRARWVIICSLVLLVLILGLRFYLAGRAPEVALATVTVTGGSSGSSGAISANGYVVARTKASVSAKIPGRLEYLGVSEGSTVRRGQILARIESADYAAALAAAKADEAEAHARLVQARADLARTTALASRGVVPRTDEENARTVVASLQASEAASAARRRLAAANLENTNVRAPFDGTVLRKDAEVGEIVAPSSAGGGLTRTAIVTMADLGTLEVEVDVAEAYIARIDNGQNARISLDAYGDTSFAGRVRQVVPTADRQKATVLVKVSILDRDPRILPEMGARVDFVPQDIAPELAALPRRMSVPLAAVDSTAQGTRVWVVEKDVVHPRPVVLGLRSGDRVEVRSGIAEDDAIVLGPFANLADGGKVRVKAKRG